MPLNKIFRQLSDLPSHIPLFPLPETLVLPRGDIPLNIFEPRYIALVDDALQSNRLIGIIQPRNGETVESHAPQLENVGCAGRITGFQETGDGRYQITLTGICRFRLLSERAVDTPYRQADVEWSEFADDLVPNAGEQDVDRPLVLATLKAFLAASDLDADWASIRLASNEALVNALTMMSPYGTREKQALLEAPNLRTRAEILVAITEMELAKNKNTDTTVQ